MKQILPLLAMQAKSDGLDDLSRHLDRAISSLDTEAGVIEGENIVDLSFELSHQRKSAGSG